jgi:hypothetical protein
MNPATILVESIRGLLVLQERSLALSEMAIPMCGIGDFCWIAQNRANLVFQRELVVQEAWGRPHVHEPEERGRRRSPLCAPTRGVRCVAPAAVPRVRCAVEASRIYRARTRGHALEPA